MGKENYAKQPIRSLLGDQEVMEELRETFSREATLEGLGTATPAADEQEREAVLSGERISEGVFTEFEAIVQTTGRPALLIQNDQYVEPKLLAIKRRLDAHRQQILAKIPSVARLELRNHPSLDYVGTAWMIADDVMITNRHVAAAFARSSNGQFVFRTNPFGETYQPQVDFKEEHRIDDAFEIEVVEVLHVEDDVDYRPDMALVRIGANPNLPGPIRLAGTDAEFGEDVAVIGYPAQDSRNDQFVMRDIFGGIYNVKRLSPGRVSGVRPNMITHDCTTLGGNSGSVVIRISTGEAVGLHFAGSYLENNYAVTASTLRNRLGALKSGAMIAVPGESDDFGAEVDTEVRRPQPTVEDLEERQGYNSGFLGREVPLPELSNSLASLVAKTISSDDGRLDYLHYSVLMHKERRMAIYTVSNIDGAESRRPRRTSDRWHYDPRLAEEFQAGQELYTSNHIHRGHLVRRLDPAWGTKKESKQAVADTFFWTNCMPQHRNFNPRTWLQLEDYVLDNADNHDIKITVFTGPVFKGTDKVYREFRIPEDYWKIVAFTHGRRRTLSATAYLLTQSEFMDDLEFVYGEYRTYQVPVSRIEELTQLCFGELGQHDPLRSIELSPKIPVESPEDIVL